MRKRPEGRARARTSDARRPPHRRALLHIRYEGSLKDEQFPHEVSDLLFDFAEKLFAEFPPNQNQPRNLMTAYFECVLYLVARMDLLLQYLAVADSDKERVIRVVLKQIEQEFGTANQGNIAEVISERMAEYERLFVSREPFTDKWYERVFSFFSARMDEALDDTRRYVWSMKSEASGARPMSREELLEIVRRVEIEHVVTFQRVVINFFSAGEDDES